MSVRCQLLPTAYFISVVLQMTGRNLRLVRVSITAAPTIIMTCIRSIALVTEVLRTQARCLYLSKKFVNKQQGVSCHEPQHIPNQFGEITSKKSCTYMKWLYYYSKLCYATRIPWITMLMGRRRPIHCQWYCKARQHFPLSFHPHWQALLNTWA